MTIQEICDSFNIGGEYKSCSELNTGIINRTYKIHYVRDNEDKFYILQRINQNVFKEPDRVMDNIVSVTEYVRENIKKQNLSTKRFVLRTFPTKDGHFYFKDSEGNYWRMYRFVPNSITYDSCDDLSVIERAGGAFGKFQNCLDGFDAGSLYISIPNFHNTPVRYKTFHDAIKDDVCGRVKSVKKEIDVYLGFEKRACLIQQYLDEGKIPLRVTHNDTKCNNVCFDKDTGEALAVIDLDTVMPGAVAYDYGDAIRFIANTLLEDDPNYDKVSLDKDKYIAFTKGFVNEVKGSLTDFEKQTLSLGAFTMTVECGMRFLTDYLQGDIYFRTKYPEHNLVRTRNQIALASDMKRKADFMQEIVDKYSK